MMAAGAVLGALGASVLLAGPEMKVERLCLGSDAWGRIVEYSDREGSDREDDACPAGTCIVIRIDSSANQVRVTDISQPLSSC